MAVSPIGALYLPAQVLPPGLPEAEVSLNLTRDVILREVTVTGQYGRRLDETWAQVEDLLSSGRLDVEPALTGAYHLSALESAFAAAQSGGVGKVIFDLANAKAAVSPCRLRKAEAGSDDAIRGRARQAGSVGGGR